MDTNNFGTVNLTVEENEEINGGLFFLVPWIVAAAANTTAAAVLVAPVAGAFHQGWNAYEEK